MSTQSNPFEVSARVFGAAIQVLAQHVAVLSVRVRELEAAAGLPSMRADEEHPGTPEGGARAERLAPEAERVRLAIHNAIDEAIEDVKKRLPPEEER